MKKFGMLIFCAFLLSCGSDDDASTATSTQFTGALGQLNSAATAVSSAGDEFDTVTKMASYESASHRLKKSRIKLSTEAQSSSLTYCSNKGGAWDSANSEQAQVDDANYAIHAIECLARVDQTTETPIGFLSQIAFIGCILEEAGADLNVTATTTYSNISVNPANGSARCKTLTNTNITDDTTDYTFNVIVTLAPTGWDKKVEIKIGSDPFYTILIAEAAGKLAIKAAEYDGANAGGTFDVNMNSTTGVLIFESTSVTNFGHARLKMEGALSSSFEFTSVSDVEGVTIICHGTNGCNGGSGSYSGATVKGALGALDYEAIQVTGSTCDLGQSGCSGTTGTDCSNGSGCLTYGSHATNTFADDDSFSTDMDNLTSGPICYSSVGVTTAPARSLLSSCTL
jgi:hypothetical protein